MLSRAAEDTAAYYGAETAAETFLKKTLASFPDQVYNSGAFSQEAGLVHR